MLPKFGPTANMDIVENDLFSWLICLDTMAGKSPVYTLYSINRAKGTISIIGRELYLSQCQDIVRRQQNS